MDATLSPWAQTRQWLRTARHVVCLTGAGCSAESGIPTFRDAQTGYWSRFDPEDLASAAGFRRHPARVWQWYRERWRQVRQSAPHAGHYQLAELARRVPRFDLITQNVDDLHERAGHASVLHLHGELARFQCLSCRAPHAPRPGDLDRETPPLCRQCQGLIRPAVVWFGEFLDPGIWRQARTASTACDLMLVVGTSGMAVPAADLPVLARQGGAKVVELNPEATAISAVAQVALRAPARQGLRRLLAENGAH